MWCWVFRQSMSLLKLPRGRSFFIYVCHVYWWLSSPLLSYFNTKDIYISPKAVTFVCHMMHGPKKFRWLISGAAWVSKCACLFLKFFQNIRRDVNALRGKSKPSRPYNRRHAPVLTSLISLWELHQWSSPLPVLPSVQSSMTCLCLETSLLMQRSHWHLMSQHFCRKLVSGISTATTNSVPCIVGLLKPQRCHDMVTHPPKGDRDLSRSHAVFTACDSKSTQISSGAIHAMNSWLALAGSGT